MFIFMALEQKAPTEYEEFSDEQMEWVKGLLKQNYTKRKPQAPNQAKRAAFLSYEENRTKRQ